MTAVDIDAIRARLAAATPGPWNPPTAPEGIDRAEWFEHEIPAVWVLTDDLDDERLVEGLVCRLCQHLSPGDVLADADLIASAPTDLAALCDEVEALRAELAAERSRCNALMERNAQLQFRLDGPPEVTT